MNKRTMVSIILSSGLALATLPVAADDDHDERGWRGWFQSEAEAPERVAPVNNELYQSECGSCHMAYPPGLLPANAWERIMATLDRHFGDNAELGPKEAGQIRAYLVDNAAGGRIGMMAAGTLARNDAPMRITEMAYFRDEHDEIPGQVIKANDKVRSLANCNACHTQADRGVFSERTVRIPGLGRWDD